jgi:hypothetical protein
VGGLVRQAGEGIEGLTVDHKAIIRKLQEFSSRSEQYPNRLVMTEATLNELKQSIKRNEAEVRSLPSDLDRFAGLPFETYATTRECLDRMWEPGIGERLLFLHSKPISFEDSNHPWVRDWLGQYAKQYAMEPNNVSLDGDQIIHRDPERRLVSIFEPEKKAL